MSTNKKFKALVSKEETNTVKRNKERIKNRAMLRESQAIALKVLDKLDQLNWTQKKLAEKLNVSPQQISKIVSGKENLTLETQAKLQEALDIPILATYLEKRNKEENNTRSWSSEQTVEVRKNETVTMSIIPGGKFTRKISGTQKVNPQKMDFQQLQM